MKLSKTGMGTTKLNNIDEMYPGQSILLQTGQLVQYGAGIFAYNTIPLLVRRKIEQINIPLDFNVPLFTLSGNNYKGYPSIWLNDNNILSIAQNLKDNSNESTSNTLIFNTLDEFRFTHIFVDSTSGQQVSENTTGAITLLQYIQNKNWTVSFN